MITAVDSSVLLDVLCNDPNHAASSASTLRRAMMEGRLIVCECVVAEVLPALGDAEFGRFMTDWRMDFVPSSLESARLAGVRFRLYAKRRREARRVLPDFLIGAHARLMADRLLARDRGYFRDYFRGLDVMEP